MALFTSGVVGSSTPPANGSTDGNLVADRVSGTDISSDGAVILGVTDTSATRTATLLTVDISVEGQLFIIKDESGGAGTNNITVVGEGGETIDGAPNIPIIVNYGVVRVYSDGSKLFSF